MNKYLLAQIINTIRYGEITQSAYWHFDDYFIRGQNCKNKNKYQLALRHSFSEQYNNIICIGNKEWVAIPANWPQKPKLTIPYKEFNLLLGACRVTLHNIRTLPSSIPQSDPLYDLSILATGNFNCLTQRECKILLARIQEQHSKMSSEEMAASQFLTKTR